jgi:LacI family transcriptional regulator, repressor for deo operon, udp, cdd, tsx, nupC, and nupG
MSDINEVAKAAGVSVATVSRVINQQSSVSEKTRKKVQQAIEMLNYEPNMLGRNLRSSKSRMLLILIPTISNSFYYNVIEGIEEITSQYDYNILLCTTDKDPKKEKTYFDLVKQKLADGMICMDPSVSIDKWIGSGTQYAIVRCCEYSEDDKTPFVSIDNTTAAYRAVKHLISLGHRNISMINSSGLGADAELRQWGYIKAMEESGIEIQPEWLMQAELDFAGGYQAVSKLLNLATRPTAIFASADTIAIGALKRIKEFGLTVPKDIAVIGFDNIDFSAMTNPTLTTISQPMRKMGREAAKMLLQRINQPDARIESLILEHELIVRESTMS